MPSNAPTIYHSPAPSGVHQTEHSYEAVVRSTLLKLGANDPDADTAATNDFWRHCMAAGIPPETTAAVIYSTARHRHAGTSTLREAGEAPTREEWEVIARRSGPMEALFNAAGRKATAVEGSLVVFGDFYDDETARDFARKLTKAGYIVTYGPHKLPEQAAEAGLCEGDASAMGASKAAPVISEPAEEALYHGSPGSLKPDTTLKARDRTKTKKADLPLEAFLERHRPEGAVSRLKALYATDRRSEVELAGGQTYTYSGDKGHLYLVEPIGPYTRVHYGWVLEILSVAGGAAYFSKTFKNSHDPKLIRLADNYWSGRPYTGREPGTWEILMSNMRIVKEIEWPKQKQPGGGLRAVTEAPMVSEVAPVISESNRIPWVKVERNQKLHEAAMELASKYGPIGSAQKVYEVVGPDFEKEDQEVFLVLPLNLRGELKSPPIEIARGQRSHVAVGVNDVLRAVLDSGCEGYFVAHSHPTGRCTPSKADRDLTNQIKAATVPFGREVKYLDHFVVGRRQIYSIEEGKAYKIK